MPHDIEEVLAAAALALLPAPTTSSGRTAPARTTRTRASTPRRSTTSSPSGLTRIRSRCSRCAGGPRMSCSARSAGAPRKGQRRERRARGSRRLMQRLRPRSRGRCRSLLDRFWSSGPELAELRVSPLAAEVPDALLRQLGPAPVSVGERDLADVLAPAYAQLAARAERRALAERMRRKAWCAWHWRSRRRRRSCAHVRLTVRERLKRHASDGGTAPARDQHPLPRLRSPVCRTHFGGTLASAQARHQAQDLIDPTPTSPVQAGIPRHPDPLGVCVLQVQQRDPRAVVLAFRCLRGNP